MDSSETSNYLENDPKARSWLARRSRRAWKQVSCTDLASWLRQFDLVSLMERQSYGSHEEQLR